MRKLTVPGDDVANGSSLKLEWRVATPGMCEITDHFPELYPALVQCSKHQPCERCRSIIISPEGFSGSNTFFLCGPNKDK